MSEELRKPRPSEAAQSFLSHPLNLLKSEIMLDQHSFITYKEDDAHIILKPYSTYADLKEYLYDHEIVITVSDVFLDAEETDPELAKKIDFIRSIPKPYEKHVKADLLTSIKKFYEHIDTQLKLPGFFEVIESIARGTTPPPHYKEILKDGCKPLDAIANMLMDMKKSLNDSEIRSLIKENAEKKLGKFLSAKDQYTDESIERAFVRPFETAYLLAPQITDFCNNARALLRVLAPTIQRE